MKVALIAEWVDPWRGGAETSTTQFMHHLIQKGVEVHLFSRSRPSPMPGLVVHTIRGASMSRVRRSATFAHWVERRLGSASFDLTHAISPCRFVDIYQPRGGTVAETIERNLSLRRPGLARALKRHANRLNFKQRYMLRLERTLMNDAAGPLIVAISDNVVDQLRRHYALPEKRVVKVFNGVDAPLVSNHVRASDRAQIRQELGLAATDCVVLLVAHNFRLKGVRSWMEAQALLTRRGLTSVRSVVVGRGESQRWHALAGRLGIARQLTFVGPSDRVPAFRHACDILVHPTHYDPCSRVVLEAMISGLPAITTRCDGASEQIVDGVSGFVLSDPTDVAGLADRVEDLLDPQVRREMGRHAAEIRQQVSMERHASQMLDIYETLLRTRTYPGTPSEPRP